MNQERFVNYGRVLILLAALILITLIVISPGYCGDSYIISKGTLNRAASPTMYLKFSYSNIGVRSKFGFCKDVKSYAENIDVHSIEVKLGVLNIIDTKVVETVNYLAPGSIYQFRITPGKDGGALYEWDNGANVWDVIYDSRKSTSRNKVSLLRVYTTSLYKGAYAEFSDIKVTSSGKSLLKTDFPNSPDLESKWIVGSESAPTPDISQDGMIKFQNSIPKHIVSKVKAQRENTPSIEFKLQYVKGDNAGYLGFIRSTTNLEGDPELMNMTQIVATVLIIGGGCYYSEASGGNYKPLNVSLKAGEWSAFKITLGIDSGALYEWKENPDKDDWKALADTRGKGNNAPTVRVYLDQRVTGGEIDFDDLKSTNMDGFADNFDGKQIDIGKWMPAAYMHCDTNSVSIVNGALRIHGTSEKAYDKWSEVIWDQSNLRPLYNKMVGRLNKIGYPKNMASFKQDKDTIKIIREMSTINFSKKNGTVDRVDIRGFKMDKGNLVSNLILNQGDKEYEQRYSNDCSLKIREQIPYYILEGKFTPKTKSGESFPYKVNVYYKLFQMSGVLYSKYSFDVKNGQAEPKLTMLRIENTMGQTPRELNTMHLGYFDGVGTPTYGLISKDSKKVANEKAEFSSLTWGANR